MKRNKRPRHQEFLCRRLSTLLLLGVCATKLSAQVLPPPPVQSDSSRKLPAATRLFVRAYHFEGNTAFTDEELSRVTEPFTNRQISNEDLQAARRAVSLHYVNHGYVNSGAVIPDQSPTNGIITLRIIEGVLSGIDLHGNRWLSDRYINARLKRWSEPPLNLNRLQEGLQLLRQNPNVKQINAELKPGTAPGEGRMDIRVVDEQPFRIGVQVDNERAPSVGAEQVSLLASVLNLTGHSDPLHLRYGIANNSDDGFEFSGTDNLEGNYQLPLNRYDTTLSLHASRLDTAIVEETFLPLDITSRTTTYGIALRQPVYQTANQEAAVSIGFDRRQNESWVFDRPDNSVSPGAVDGETVVSVLRFSQEWIQRGQNHVLSLRSTFNFGLDVLDATDDGLSRSPDATYFSWLGQGQYVQRLFNTQNQLILRVAGQWTDDPLLALEQISVGGVETVRGYRENQLVRDRGIVSSVEFRLPVWFDKSGAGIVHVAPFFDFGGGWDELGSENPKTISSTGLGLLLNPDRRINAQLYWGYRLRNVDKPDDRDVQDLGLHFRINIQAF